jgi:hypothetical protein
MRLDGTAFRRGRAVTRNTLNKASAEDPSICHEMSQRTSKMHEYLQDKDLKGRRHFEEWENNVKFYLR